MIGTAEGALAAVKGSLPAVGVGYYRITYRDGDVVYKVGRGAGGVASNEREHATVERLRAEGGVALLGLPETTLWHPRGVPVVAMPYYGPLGDERPEDERTLHWVRERYDVHKDHLRRTADGRVVVCDLG